MRFPLQHIEHHLICAFGVRELRIVGEQDANLIVQAALHHFKHDQSSATRYDQSIEVVEIAHVLGDFVDDVVRDGTDNVLKTRF